MSRVTKPMFIVWPVATISMISAWETEQIPPAQRHAPHAMRTATQMRATVGTSVRSEIQIQGKIREVITAPVGIPAAPVNWPAIALCINARVVLAQAAEQPTRTAWSSVVSESKVWQPFSVTLETVNEDKRQPRHQEITIVIDRPVNCRHVVDRDRDSDLASL